MTIDSALLDHTEQLLTASCVPPLYRVPDPVDVPGVRFDIERVARVVGVAQQFVHIKAEWRGRPVMLEPWEVQHVIAPLYGWVWGETGLRVRRYGFIELPRKNGKSMTVAVMAANALVADGENAPEVYCAATSRDQALEVYYPAEQMLLSCESLRGKLQGLKDRVNVRGNGGVMKPVSRNAAGGHGPSTHFGAFDEIHLHKSPDLIEGYETSTGAREQPLIVAITTADEGTPGTVYDERRREIEQLADGTLPYDPTRFGVVYAAAADMDPLSPEAYEAANPNLGVSVKRAYLEEQRTKALNNPGFLPTYRRLHLGQRVRAASGWVNMDHFANCPHDLSWEDVRGLPAFGGMDLAAVDDFTAVAWWILLPGGDVAAFVRAFVSHAAVQRRGNQLQRVIANWEAEGWLQVTPGNVTNFAAVKAEVVAGMEHLTVQGIGHDPWQSNQLASELVAEGVPMYEKRQTFDGLGAGASLVASMIADRRLNTDGSPVLRWMLGNTVPKANPSDPEVKLPDKKNSGEKIDGVTALVIAAAVAAGEEGLPDLGLQVV